MPRRRWTLIKRQLFILTFTLNLCNNATAMVPIPYFLALIAILVSLMGCTQKAPPGAPQLVSANNTTGLVESSVHQPRQGFRHRHGGDSTVKPSTADVSGVAMLASDIHQLLVMGEDAKNLYQLLEVKTVDGLTFDGVKADIKNAVQLRCFYTDKYFCNLFLQSENGELLTLTDPANLDKAEAEKSMTQPENNSTFQLDPLSVGKTARMFITAENGRKIFDGLRLDDSKVSKLDDTDLLSGQVLKKGENVSCLKSVQKSDGAILHTCTFWFNYDTGAFDKIQ